MLPSGSYGAVQVTEKLLDNGRFRTQAGWQAYRNETGWGPGSAPLQFALHSAVYDNNIAILAALAEGRGDAEKLRVTLASVKKLRSLFAGDFRNRWMMTATGVTYRAGASGIVTHDAGTPEERTLEARLAGPNGRIDDGMSGEMQALLGSPDVKRVSDVYKWITGKKSYLWRIDKAPEIGTERALVLGVSSLNDVFVIYADVGIVGSGGSARGVRVAPQSST